MAEAAADTQHRSDFKAPLRIALLGYRSNPFSGGQGVYIRNVALSLAQRGHQIDVFSAAPYPQLPEHNGIRLIKVPSLNLYDVENPFLALRLNHLSSWADTAEWLAMNTGGFAEPYAFGRRIYKHLKLHGNYDIIHDNQTLSWGTLALQKHVTPLVTTLHHPITFDREIALNHEQRWWMRLLIRRWHNFLNMQTKVTRRLHNIITVSENSKRDIAQAFQVKENNISVIPNGIDVEFYKPDPTVQRDQWHLISTASADQPLKGTQYLIPAFAELRKEHPQLRLTFIGHPKPNGVTAQLIDKFQLKDHITFARGITNKELVALYNRATVAVVPSEYEGFGLPAAEAMACGIPVVSSDGGALPEVVGTAGLVVPAKNVEKLTFAIHRLLTNPDKCHTLSKLGRERILSCFNQENIGQQLEQYYLDLIQSQTSDHTLTQQAQP